MNIVILGADTIGSYLAAKLSVLTPGDTAIVLSSPATIPEVVKIL